MRTSSFFREKWVLGLLLLFALVAMGALLWLTQYSHPAADDYDYALRDSQQGFWAIQKETYLNWSGRYFGTAILQLNPLKYGSFSGYRLVSFGMIIAFGAGLYVTVYQLFKHHWPALNRKAFAALLLLLYLVQCPSLSEAFFWLTGFLTYTVSCVLFLLVLVLTNQMICSERKSSKMLYATGASLLGIMVIGSNEMALIMLLSTLWVLTAYHWKAKSTQTTYLLAISLAYLLAAILMVTAPGNFQRMSSEPKAQNLFWSVAYSSGLTGIAFVKWAVPLLMGSLVYALFIFPKQPANKALNRLFSLELRWFAFFYLATLFAMHFLFVWSTGERPTPRLENVIYFYLLLGWFYGLHALLVRLPDDGFSWSYPDLVPAGTFLLFAAHLFTVQNPISSAITDIITGHAARYDKEMRARYAIFTNSPCQVCPVPPLSEAPPSIVFIDIATKQDTAKEWVNEGTAAFWQKKQVYLTSPNPPEEDNQTIITRWGKGLLSN